MQRQAYAYAHSIAKGAYIFFYSSTSIKNTSKTGTHGAHFARTLSGKLCISFCWIICHSATTTPVISNARKSPILYDSEEQNGIKYV